MASMADGVAILGDMDFEVVPTDLPGAWATDGEWTVAIHTRPVDGGPVADECHRVLVYETPASDVGVDTALAGESTSTAVESALRSALSRAEYHTGRRRKPIAALVRPLGEASHSSRSST